MSELAVRDEAAAMRGLILSDDFQNQTALALPEGLSAHRFLRAAATALLDEKNAATILKLDRASVFSALLKAAQDGLVPDGREAAIVGYGNKATYLPMIAGVRKIAAESGWAVRTVVVYANDEFSVALGTDETIHHVPAVGDRGDLHAAYAIGVHRDHPRMVEVMYRPDIEKARNVSRAKGSGPWKDWEDRMWEKTVGHRLIKKLPLDPGAHDRLRRAVEQMMLEPGQAAAAIYGHAPVAGELPPARTDTSGREPTDPGASTGGQQTGDRAETPTGPAPVPDEPASPFNKEEPSFPLPEDAIRAAATDALDVVIPESSMKGQKLGRLVDTPNVEKRDEWARWALSVLPSHWSSDDDPDGAGFHRALELVVAVFLPEVWQQHLDATGKAVA